MTVTKQGGGQVVLQPKIVVPVNVAGWKGSVMALKSAAAGMYGGRPVIMYATFALNEGGQPGRLFFAGISWASLAPINPNNGSFKVVQLITGGNIVVKNAAGVVVSTGFYNATTGKFATFPLVDVAANATSPFYEDSFGVKTDSPYMPLFLNDTTVMNISFKDYVMFQAKNGVIWVPQGTFSWVVNASSTLTKVNNVWKTNTKTTQAGLTAKPAINHTTWPGGWTDIAANYRGFNPALPPP